MKATGMILSYSSASFINTINRLYKLVTDIGFYIHKSLKYWWDQIWPVWKTMDLVNIGLGLEITISGFIVCWIKGHELLNERIRRRIKLENLYKESGNTGNIFRWARLRLSQGIFKNKPSQNNHLFNINPSGESHAA